MTEELKLYTPTAEDVDEVFGELASVINAKGYSAAKAVIPLVELLILCAQVAHLDKGKLLTVVNNYYDDFLDNADEVEEILSKVLDAKGVADAAESSV